ncbi:salto isoform 2-T2 [Cochliomyia hominivorax]
MDNSAIVLAEKTEDHLDVMKLKAQDHVKPLDQSPTRSSIKSFKTTDIGSRASVKSIPKPSVNMSPLKAENKSLTNLRKSESPKMSSPIQPINKKTISPVISKSQNSAAKSKIPARTSLNNLTTKTKTQLQQKPPELIQQPAKRPLAEKKTLEQKIQQNTRSNSKASLSRSETLQCNKIVPNISKASFITTPSLPLQKAKKMVKSQSARSSSQTPVPVTSKRSASNISARSIPYSNKKSEYITNLRKMISTAGDHEKLKDLKPKQSEVLPKRENLIEAVEFCNSKASQTVDDFKNNVQNHIKEWFSEVKGELNDPGDKDNLEHLEILESHDLLNLIDDFCKICNENTNLQIDKLESELKESGKSLKKEQEKYNDLKRQIEEERFQFVKEIEDKAQVDITRKLEEIKELQKKLKLCEKELNNLKTSVSNLKKEKENVLNENEKLQEELTMSRESITSTNKKLQQVEQQLGHDKKELKVKMELIKKLEIDLEDKKKLEIDLKEKSKKLEDLEIKLKNKTYNECLDHLKQISDLNSQLKCLESEKEEFKQQNESLEQEVREMGKINQKLKEAENKIQSLQKEIEAKEKLSEILPESTKDLQMEIAKLHQSDAEKRREIEKLKIELSKAHFNISQLDQQIQRDTQLLEVRSELIKSLQANEKTHRIHMEELFAQVGEKNTTINELNCELQVKSEEFRNLFNSLSAKQVEASNQEHIIKLLEESNERSQLLRVKQEEKIGRMEEELAHLKQTIAIYHGNLLMQNNGKPFLLAPVLPPSNVDYNENFYYYVNQRKRKRQVDINVKKYEA